MAVDKEYISHLFLRNEHNLYVLLYIGGIDDETSKHLLYLLLFEPSGLFFHICMV